MGLQPEGVWARGCEDRGEECVAGTKMRRGHDRHWSALHSLLHLCCGLFCPLGLILLGLPVGTEVWEVCFQAQALSRAQGAKNENLSQPDCFLSVPTMQNSRIAAGSPRRAALTAHVHPLSRLRLSGSPWQDRPLHSSQRSPSHVLFGP